MTPERAVENLKELGFVLKEVTRRGGSKWVLPGHGQEIYIPGPAGVQIIPESFIELARANALNLSIKGVVVLREEPR